MALVDDDKVTLAILSRSLRRRGYLVRTFQDPESAIDVLCRDGPDIAVVDMQMPGITGIELVRQLEPESRRARLQCRPLRFLAERPHLPRAMGSGMFDDDGVATRDREIVQNGVLNGYFLSTYSARKLGMQTTGNAGGSHNLIVRPGTRSLVDMIGSIKRGLLVTELLGHGVNYVTGDYSRGAAGYWIENGQIAYPVQEITIAGNLRDMYMGIKEVGADTLVRGSKQCGSILIDRMRIAGA